MADKKNATVSVDTAGLERGEVAEALVNGPEGKVLVLAVRCDMPEDHGDLLWFNQKRNAAGVPQTDKNGKVHIPGLLLATSRGFKAITGVTGGSYSLNVRKAPHPLQVASATEGDDPAIIIPE